MESTQEKSQLLPWFRWTNGLSWPGLCILSLTLLGVLIPRVSRGDSIEPPAIRHDQIVWEDDVAFSPLRSGHGRARLTLNHELQSTAHQLLSRAHPVTGAVIALDARSGRVLVWAAFDREARGVEAPLLDSYPAASLFKIVTTAALLEHTKIQGRKRFCTRGGQHGIERRHLDPPKPGTTVRCDSFQVALGLSRNAVYAQLATHYLTRSQLASTAQALGFNETLPFDFPAQLGRLQLPYNDLEFARAAAGFQDSSITPLGAAHLAHTIAARGERRRIYLVDAAPGYSRPKGGQRLGRALRVETARRLRNMMEITITSGTSYETFTDAEQRPYLGRLNVAGKTGTLRRNSDGPTTSWFVGFAPSRKPQIIVSVVLQNAPVWRQKANELGRDLMRAHFANRGFRGVTHPFSAK